VIVLGKASRTHSENHSELGGNTLGIKKSFKKFSSPPFLPGKIVGPLGLMLSRLIGCLKFLFLKLFVTDFGMG